MTNIKVQKIKLLKIWEILHRKTDEQNPISTQELIAALNELGITADRRTIYADIETMQSYGYEISKRRRGHEMVYWVQKRDFDLPEIKILMDCVHSAKFVTEKKTEELINKIADLGGSCRGELLKRNAVHFDTVKHTNEDVYRIVDVLEKAIENCRKVSFRYFLLNDRGERVYKHDRRLYTEEPLAMVCDDGNYYLLCYRAEEEYKNHIKIFRIDRIEGILVLADEISDNGKDALNKAADYPRQVFKMYDGVLRKVTLEFDEKLIGVIYNEFGEQTFIRRSGERYCATVHVQISPTFWGWIMQFPSQMKIKSPEDLKQKYREWALLALEEDLSD